MLINGISYRIKQNNVVLTFSLVSLVAMVSIGNIVCNLYAVETQFNHPRSVAVDSSGNVFVADTFNHRVQKFSNTGDFPAD